MRQAAIARSPLLVGCTSGLDVENLDVLSVCGDAIISETEACDDGNAQLGDGCSDVCRVCAHGSPMEAEMRYEV